MREDHAGPRRGEERDRVGAHDGCQRGHRAVRRERLRCLSSAERRWQTTRMDRVEIIPTCRGMPPRSTWPTSWATGCKTSPRSRVVLVNRFSSPAWDADGTLYFLSDRSDWWNLYRWTGARVEPVLQLEAEIAGPLWVLGQSNYALTGDARAVLRYGVNALDKLGVLDLRTGALKTLDLPFTSISSIALESSDVALAIAASHTEEAARRAHRPAHRSLHRDAGAGEFRLSPANVVARRADRVSDR